CLVRLVRGRNLEVDLIPGRHVSAGIAAIRQVLDEDADAAIGDITPQEHVRIERAEEALGRMRYEVFLTGVVINETQLAGLDELAIESVRCCHRRREQKRCRNPQKEDARQDWSTRAVILVAQARTRVARAVTPGP